jgi:predicted kinase
MKKKILIALCGIPGSGKSTLIKMYNLTDYVVSFDEIRLELNPPYMKPNGMMGIVQDPRFLDIALKRIEVLSSAGEMIVVDATHTSDDLLIVYQEICKKYGYIFYLLDLRGVSLEICLARNATRVGENEYKFVPVDIIKKMHKKIRKLKIPSEYIVIEEDELSGIV